MQFTKRFRFLVVVTITVMLSHLPNVAFAEVALTQNQMVSTSVLVDELSREQTEQKVISYLNKDDVKQKLMDNGISADEANSRIASLSNQELQKLSQQIDQAQYGGDILYAILIVVLIIFLLQRI